MPPAMRNITRAVTLRRALLCGFGLTVSFWLLAGYLVSRRVEEAELKGAELNVSYIRAQELLSSVRAQILLASVVVRDALLDSAPRPRGDYRREVENAYLVIDAALRRYEPLGHGPTDRERVQRLRDEISAFRQASFQVLAADSQAWQAEARTLLQHVLPKRESVIAVSEELQAINRLAYVTRQTEAAHVQAEMQRQVLTVLGVATSFSLLIAWAVFGYSVRLERHLVAQRVREERSAADLQRLSAHVVKVQEEERRRIARELHDEIGQALSAVNLELTGVQRQLQKAEVPGNPLAEARVLTDGALRSARNLSQLLHPSVLEDLGLSAALRSFLNGFGRRSGLNVMFHDNGPSGRVSGDVELALYRIVQEATTNAARHAQALHVEVWLRESPSGLSVAVEDDGLGFDVEQVQRPGQHGGLGLLGIRERLSQLGGVLRLDSQPGRGTTVTATIPFTRSSENDPQSRGTLATMALRQVQHG